jgi:signal transduction histidine kinase
MPDSTGGAIDAVIDLQAGLVAWFAFAAVWYLLRWLRRRVRMDRLWFGCAAALACAVAATHDAGGMAHPAPVLAMSVALAWFAATSPPGGRRRRATAAAVAVLALFAWLAGYIPASTGIVLSAVFLLQRGAAIAAFGLTALLALHIALHAWPTQRLRAVAAVLIAYVPLVMLWNVAVEDRVSIDLFSLCALAVAAMPGMFGTWHASPAAATNAEVRDFAHTSRLAVVGELTASIAHEINQPLGAILSNADAGEMLIERVRPDDVESLAELRHILADIRRDALRASGIIRHVRTLAGRRELNFEHIDANTLAHQTVQLLEADMRRRGIAVQVVPCRGDVAIRGDRAHLEQVLINLLLNAMDAMEAQSLAQPGTAAAPIMLGVSIANHGAIEFSVVDAGQGIPEDRLHRLFHSFHSSKPHGMGLGLSIARSIVEAHGGWIRAENNRGPGATFRVTFPPYAEHGG